MQADTVPFDLLEVEHGLTGTRFLGHVLHFGSAGSTNQLAVEAAYAGTRNGVWVADEQTAGRGRGGHTWHSAPGDGLYMTALVTPSIPLADARWLPLRAGLAVRAAVQEVTGLELDLRWPNDLMFGDKKCGGILVESGSAPAPLDWPLEAGPALRFAVVGIGLNVAHTTFPRELSRPATSLLLESGRRFPREPLLAAILRHLDSETQAGEDAWRKKEDGAEVTARFSAASSWAYGKRVRVGGDEDGKESYTGLTHGLNHDGFLRVQDDEGRLKIVVSGNVRAARE